MKIWVSIAGWYIVASLITLAAYWWDKRAAARGARRIRERTLHVLELLGGWPGAFAAQRMLRHKTRDAPFLMVYWAIMGLHIAGWGVWLWR